MKKEKRKFKQTNSWIEENSYYFGERGFDKRAYDNLVLAVRETEAKVPFAESRVDWHFASLCLCLVNGNSEQFDEVQTSAALKGNKTAQAFGYEWWKFNYAFENYTVYAIEQFRQIMLVKDTNWNVGFSTWIKEQMNEDGDFVITDFGFVDVERLLVVFRFVLCVFKFSLLKVYSQYLSFHFLLHLFSCYDYCHSNMERIHFKYFIRKYLIHLRFSVAARVYKFVYKNHSKNGVFK